MTTTKGVFSDEFQLSDLPNLGNWSITAEVSGETRNHGIEVSEYVLPKFEVSIDAAEHFTVKAGKIQAVVRAKYTHGQVMKGQATLSVLPRERWGWQADEDLEPLVFKTAQCDGKATFEFDIVEDLKIDLKDEETKYYNSKDFELKLTITEDLTGLKQSAKKAITVHLKPYQFSLEALTQHFKAGDKFRGKVSCLKCLLEQCLTICFGLDFNQNPRRFSVVVERTNKAGDCHTGTVLRQRH